MEKIKNSSGVTLVELVIVAALLTAVLACAYAFFFFSYRVFGQTEAEFDVVHDARIAIMRLERDIRKAQDVTLGNGSRKKAVEIEANGRQLNIYTDADNDGNIQFVQYRLFHDGSIRRGEANVGATPTSWSTVARNVKDARIFSADGSNIKIEIALLDTGNRLADSPLSINTSVTVRSKGVME